MSVEAKLDFGGVRRDPVMNMRAQLKLATAVRHARVEEIVEARGLLRDLPGYATWLEATLVFHAAIHGAIAPLGPSDLLDALEIGRRMELIARDLDALDHPLPAWSPPVLLDAHSEIDRLGIAYVVEGASLGARILVRHVERVGCHSGHAAGFLSAQARSSDRWARLVGVLNSLDPDAAACQRMCDVSSKAFDLAAGCYGRVP